MAASPSIDRDTFLHHLRQSGLVAPAHLDEIARQHAGVTRGRSLARALVGQGVLTRFQAERILVGRTAGFLLGQYRILEQIGKGGMGRVYRAEHRTMRRMVALKVLAPNLLRTERAIQLFLHEVQAIAALQHPNIVTAYDANQINGRYFLVLEFVDGPNLDQLVRRQGPLSVGLACDYVRQAASGLQSAHQRGMVHRDIKPANILVQWHGLNGDDSPGLVKVSDFGLARLAAPISNLPGAGGTVVTILTRDDTVMGTPDYLSPEQSRNLHRTDIRADLYSLGCTFYFLLTGQVPFPGGLPLDKLIRHATEKPRPLSDFRPDVPEPVRLVVEKLMAKHPDERFATPVELADALQPFAVSGPTPWARPRTPVEVEVDNLATPADALSDEGEGFEGLGSDGELPVASTLSDGPGPQPAPLVSSRAVRRVKAVPRRWVRLILMGASVVIGGLLVAAVVLGILAR